MKELKLILLYLIFIRVNSYVKYVEYYQYNPNSPDIVDSYSLNINFASSTTNTPPAVTNLYWIKSTALDTAINSNSANYWQRHFMINKDNEQVGVNNRHYVAFEYTFRGCTCLSTSCGTANEWVQMRVNIKLFTCAKSAIEFYQTFSNTTPTVLFLNPANYVSNSIGTFATGLISKGNIVSKSTSYNPQHILKNSLDSELPLNHCNVIT